MLCQQGAEATGHCLGAAADPSPMRLAHGRHRDRVAKCRRCPSGALAKRVTPSGAHLNELLFSGSALGTMDGQR